MAVPTRLGATGYEAVQNAPRERVISALQWPAVISYLMLHVVIGLMLPRSAAAAGAHIGLVCLGSIWIAFRGSSVAAASSAAYIVGSEVLWRMTGAPGFYETGKYIVSLILLVAIMRQGRRAVWKPLPLLYFALLLPSAGLVLADRHLVLGAVTNNFSFNLSGPLSLCISVWFFSQQRFTLKELLQILLAFIGPALAIAVITLVATSTATDLVFTDESNTVTSGGFGPNQVSVILGLASVFALLVTINRKADSVTKATSACLVLLFAVESVMTFSRGGIYSASLALLAGAPFLVADKTARKILMVVGGAIAIVAITTVLPRLDEFTGGKLGERFRDTQTTHRGDLIANDLKVWADHPILGVGPGMIKGFREGPAYVGHTEYTRLLAEHGVFGLLALIALGLMALRGVMTRDNPGGRLYRAVFLAWALASMLHVDMRLAALGFIFGFAQVTLATNYQSQRSYRQPYGIFSTPSEVL